MPPRKPDIDRGDSQLVEDAVLISRSLNLNAHGQWDVD